MRFPFGKNWISFSQKALTHDRITQARDAFDTLFMGIDFSQKTFLDIGYGQGLSLLIAAEKGADTYGMDIDPENLNAIELTMSAMKTTKMPNLTTASILDDAYVQNQLARHSFNIVHSWGVLHHTGNMYQALDNALKLVADNGYFVCSIYNKHWTSPIWKAVKFTYNLFPMVLQKALIFLLYPIIFFAKLVATRKNPLTMTRGMEFFHNVVDWVGGYPYEYAHPQDFIGEVCAKGFKCVRWNPAKVPTGCNEYVFKKLT